MGIKKLFILLIIITLSLLVFSGCKGQVPSEGEGEGDSEETEVIHGPAPNSGDGVPDGPGWF